MSPTITYIMKSEDIPFPGPALYEMSLLLTISAGLQFSFTRNNKHATIKEAR